MSKIQIIITLCIRASLKAHAQKASLSHSGVAINASNIIMVDTNQDLNGLRRILRNIDMVIIDAELTKDSVFIVFDKKSQKINSSFIKSNSFEEIITFNKKENSNKKIFRLEEILSIISPNTLKKINIKSTNDKLKVLLKNEKNFYIDNNERLYINSDSDNRIEEISCKNYWKSANYAITNKFSFIDIYECYIQNDYEDFINTLKSNRIKSIYHSVNSVQDLTYHKNRKIDFVVVENLNILEKYNNQTDK